PGLAVNAAGANEFSGQGVFAFNGRGKGLIQLRFALRLLLRRHLPPHHFKVRARGGVRRTAPVRRVHRRVRTGLLPQFLRAFPPLVHVLLLEPLRLLARFILLTHLDGRGTNLQRLRGPAGKVWKRARSIALNIFEALGGDVDIGYCRQWEHHVTYPLAMYSSARAFFLALASAMSARLRCHSSRRFCSASSLRSKARASR